MKDVAMQNSDNASQLAKWQEKYGEWERKRDHQLIARADCYNSFPGKSILERMGAILDL